MAMTIVEPAGAAVTGGVDTHLDVHVAAALDDIGGVLGVESFEASRAGNDDSWRGCSPSGRSPEAVSRARAPMAPAWHDRCAPRTSRWSRSTARTAKRAGEPASPTPLTRWKRRERRCRA